MYFLGVSSFAELPNRVIVFSNTNSTSSWRVKFPFLYSIARMPGISMDILIYFSVNHPSRVESMNRHQRGEELRSIIKNIRDGKFDYKEREPPKTNWTKYDQAQIREMVLYLENIRNLVDEAVRRINDRKSQEKRKPGRPPTDPSDITKVLLLQEYTHSPNRVAAGLLLLFREKLGISRDFSYKTIERGYDRESVNEILNEVDLVANEMVDEDERIYSTDGTGLSSSNKVNYAVARQKQNANRRQCAKMAHGSQYTDLFPQSSDERKRDFTYATLCVGTKYKLIAGMAVSTDHSVGETSMFPTVFQQTFQSHPNMEEMLGDGVYASRWIVECMLKNWISPYFLPKSTVTYKSKGHFGWGRMLGSLQQDPQNWMHHYHMRSISETVNSMIECRFQKRTKKRLAARKRTETRLKGVAHNVRRVGYIEILYDIKPHWRRWAA